MEGGGGVSRDTFYISIPTVRKMTLKHVYVSVGVFEHRMAESFTSFSSIRF